MLTLPIVASLSKDDKSTQELERRLSELEAKLKESIPKKDAEELRKKISELESYLKKYQEELEAAKRTIKGLAITFTGCSE